MSKLSEAIKQFTKALPDNASALEADFGSQPNKWGLAARTEEKHKWEHKIGVGNVCSCGRLFGDDESPCATSGIIEKILTNDEVGELLISFFQSAFPPDYRAEVSHDGKNVYYFKLPSGERPRDGKGKNP